MPAWLGIVAVAALFVVFAALKPRHCTGHCAGCGSACDHHRGEHHDAE